MWEVYIEVINESKSLIKLLAVRIDPVTDEVWRCRLTGLIETPAQRSALLQDIKDKYLAKLATDIRIENTLAGLSQTAENALNIWDETI